MSIIRQAEQNNNDRHTTADVYMRRLRLRAAYTSSLLVYFGRFKGSDEPELGVPVDITLNLTLLDCVQHLSGT